VQVRRPLLVAVLAVATPASAEDGGVVEETEAKPADVDLRLTLSSFLFRESGDDAQPLVMGGAAVAGASPVRRYFGDLRVELVDGGFELDARVRQTTSERYQSGAAGGGEYEIRTLRLRAGSARTGLYVGRQSIEAVGATKIDGLAFVQKLSRVWSGTLFGGAFPQLGSRSLDTDYPEIRNADGSYGSPLVPIAGGLGASYSKGTIHGSIGAAAVYVMQEVPDATSSEKSRVFVTANGYARPARWLDFYHFGLLDIGGGVGASLTNGSLGVDVHPVTNLKVSASVNHVGTDLLQIAARNTLVEPDPSVMGIVQNHISIVRVSQDVVRGGASLAMARSRFELSVSAGLRRRPRVDVALADPSVDVAFPEAKSADVTMTILDRRSLAGLRTSATTMLIYALGDDVPNRSNGSTIRLVAGRAFAGSRGELELDVAAQRFQDVSAGSGACANSLDVFACYGASTITAGQTGVLASWRIGREWLVIADVHAGARGVTSTTVMGRVDYPTAYSLSAFARVQWRYR
jgi:hypothetical protein